MDYSRTARSLTEFDSRMGSATMRLASQGDIVWLRWWQIGDATASKQEQDEKNK